ncbi:MAG: GNAT family N-acetyltransferase [Pseudomonadota bacterium]
MSNLTMRPATRADLPAIEHLLSKSYGRLLAQDYPPSVMVTAVPLISRAQPKLVASGTYYMVFRDHDLLAVGGWTRATPHGQWGDNTLGHVRHVATDPGATRQGAATALLRRCQDEARAAGLSGLHCMSTRTAEPFYRALGFAVLGAREIALGQGILFPAVEMVWHP